MIRPRSIISGFLAGFIAALAAGAAPAGAAETLTGELAYVPRPDIALCFCGSFPLLGESEGKIVYLVSADIDLAVYVGERVTVSGKSFTATCSGTLALPCEYFAVEKIVPTTRADTGPASWGAIKALYR